jgi:predicted Zn-dependent protease
LSTSADLELMRAATLLDTDAAAAARRAREILKSEPRHEAAALLLAAACRRLGESASAIGVIEELAATWPDTAVLQLELGRIYAASGRSAEATAALQRAIDLDARLAEPWRELSALRLSAGDIVAADAAYLRYRRLASNPVDLLEAYAAFDNGRFDAASSLVHQGLEAGTNEVAAHTLLSAIASRRGDKLSEEAELREVLRLAPCDNTAREQLARLLLRQGRAYEALQLADRLVAAEPRHRDLAILKADALRVSDRHAEGLAILDRCLAEHPDDPDLRLLAGNQQRYLGRPAEAIEAYRRCLVSNPDYGAAYLALSNLKTFRFSAEEIADMKRLLSKAVQEPNRMDLNFALGKALEDEGEFAESFHHYAEGNRLGRATFNYDPNAQSAYVRRFKATFDSAFFAQRKDWGIESTEPIFIVGLPRSGSTLLEQILASHSQIEGTRELAYVPMIARELAGEPVTAAIYPENLRSLRQCDVKVLADRYLAEAAKHRLQGKMHFIDKMHGNFASVGLIHLMFPRAAIIDARRHPMACGFACYKQLFAPGMNFAYDLTEIGMYYRDYVDLMNHVDGVLPGRVHRVHYENIVADTGAEVRRLLEHCDLQFEPQCLRFHENRRVAQTISSEQVRLPIYKDGLQQWQNFEPWLGLLKSALGRAAGEYLP